jgi:sugar lactone lactonase YvrE
MTTDTPQAVWATPMQVGECPLWHPEEASLYWIDIPDRTVHRLHPESGVYCQWALPAEPGAIAYCASGGLIVALRNGFARLNTVSGQLSMIAPAPYDTGTTRFNDGRCDAAGRFWVGTMYEPRDRQLGQMFYLERGVVKLAWSGHMTVSNGLAFSPDNRTLYHADTTSHVIESHEFDLASGQVGAPRLFKQFSTDRIHNYGGRPDGAAVDSEGAYWCAMIEGGRLLRLSPTGNILREVALPLRCPTMLAFGGPDLRTLYITSISHNRSEAELAQWPLSGCVLSLPVEVAGRPEPAYIE